MFPNLSEKGAKTLLCQFERLIYPQSVSAIDAGSFMIAVYRPCEKIKDSAGDLVTQVKAVGYDLPITPTREGIIAYLSSGQIKGIGPKMAEKIFDAFGLTALEVLDIIIDKVMVFPQAYAAVVPQSSMIVNTPRIFIVDIGGYTAFLMKYIHTIYLYD